MSEKTTLEQYLAMNGRLVYTNKGVSMLPLIREGRDMFIITSKGEGRCRAGDVVLYRRNGNYVLHRIVDVRPNDYVILGDNCICREYGITDGDILGTMTGFIRDGREHSTSELPYKLYMIIWLWTERPRVFAKKVIHRAKRFLRCRLYKLGQ